MHVHTYRGTSLIGNSPTPPQDHPRTLGAVLLKGPRRGMFFMSEVPLYRWFEGVRLGRQGIAPGTTIHTVDLDGFGASRFRASRDQIYTTCGPEINCARRVDFG